MLFLTYRKKGFVLPQSSDTWQGFSKILSDNQVLPEKLYNNSSEKIRYLNEKLKLLNSWKALIIPAIFSPFGTVWLTFVFQAIPDSTLDAARMDGVNQLQMIRYIIVPNSKPAVITLFILVFTESWNMVEQPILFLEKETDYPLSVFLASLNQNAV